MKRRTLLKSLNDAVGGVVYVIRYERNMSLHFLFAVLVLLSAIVLGVPQTQWILLCFCVILVLVAEMINTAIEHLVDLVKDTFHPQARIIKHISAGMVLVSAAGAMIVGVLIFSRYLRAPWGTVITEVRYAPWYIAFMSVLVVIFWVIAGKAYLHKGTPFRGGPISGHTAAAFSLWTVLLFRQSDVFITAIGFLIACLVAQSRLRAKIHTFWEVVAGAVVGFSVTALFFKLFIK